MKINPLPPFCLTPSITPFICSLSYSFLHGIRAKLYRKILAVLTPVLKVSFLHSRITRQLINETLLIQNPSHKNGYRTYWPERAVHLITHGICILLIRSMEGTGKQDIIYFLYYEGESESKGKIHFTALIEVTVSNFTYNFST